VAAGGSVASGGGVAGGGSAARGGSISGGCGVASRGCVGVAVVAAIHAKGVLHGIRSTLSHALHLLSSLQKNIYDFNFNIIISIFVQYYQYFSIGVKCPNNSI
jgi:uncharacterized protein (UPF0264 family)